MLIQEGYFNRICVDGLDPDLRKQQTGGQCSQQDCHEPSFCHILLHAILIKRFTKPVYFDFKVT
ncbi:MAG: hypothetical protein BWY39_00670 [Spirochaetes bacterium ADurb.Bin269]|nr:MAG: hypothetical protein BWY39_00670 [Spirochaetes bacterium ADurb.Bin269]